MGIDGLEVTLEGAGQAIVTGEVEDNGGIKNDFSMFGLRNWIGGGPGESPGCSGVGFTPHVQMELLGRAGLEASLWVWSKICSWSRAWKSM